MGIVHSSRICRLLVAAAIAAGIGLVIFWRAPRPLDAPLKQATPVQALAPAEAPSFRAGTANPVPASPAINFAEIPAAVAPDAGRRYAFIRDCMKFRHFDSFYREQAADPSWPLNNPDALAAAPLEMRSALLNTSRFLDEHRNACEPWLEASSQDQQNAQVYEAALQAALQGDQGAAACFVMAPWQKPSEQGPHYEGLAKAYATHAKRFAQEGLRAGSWPIVLAASQATQAQHGLQATSGLSNQDKYLLLRLAQLGSTDHAGQSPYDDGVTSAARHLTAEALISLDKRAADLFANEFKGGQVSVQAVTDTCVN